MGFDQAKGETTYMPVMDPLGPLVILSPLTDTFSFNFSFPLLPDLFFYNTP